MEWGETIPIFLAHESLANIMLQEHKDMVLLRICIVEKMMQCVPAFVIRGGKVCLVVQNLNSGACFFGEPMLVVPSPW